MDNEMTVLSKDEMTNEQTVDLPPTPRNRHERRKAAVLARRKGNPYNERKHRKRIKMLFGMRPERKRIGYCAVCAGDIHRGNTHVDMGTNDPRMGTLPVIGYEQVTHVRIHKACA